MARQHRGIAGHDVVLTFFILEHVVVCISALVETSGDADGTGIFLLLSSEGQGKQKRRQQGSDEQDFTVHATSLDLGLGAKCIMALGNASSAGEGRLRMSDEKTLYARLGGYDAIAAVADNLLPRLMSDERLGRFWAHRGEDGVRREKQLLIDFLCHCAGGPLLYTGRDMKTSHKGMRISEDDWAAFLGHVNATLDEFRVPAAEREQVIAFVQSTKADIVEHAASATA